MTGYPQPPSAMFNNFSGIKVTSDPNCLSTKEFRTRTRTWFERFVDGPVWAPKKATYQEGIPVTYRLNLPGVQEHIIAHPEIVAEMEKQLGPLP